MQIDPNNIPTQKGFHKLVLTINKNFKINDIATFRKHIKNKCKQLTKSLNETELYEFMTKEMNVFTQSKKLSTLFAPNKHVLKSNNFKWIADLDLTLNEAQDLMLIKGVAMSAGTKKDNDIETDENIIFASGAMAAAALQNKSNINIDHFEESLPVDEYNEYDVKAINAIYPPARTLAVGIAKNEMGESKTPTIQTEFIAVCSNATVYEMVKNGEFVGCSTVELLSKRNCECNNENHDCGCTLQGSQFTDNTLILKGVPNSEGTWVSAVDKSDIGVIVSELKTKNTVPNKDKQRIINSIKQTYHKTKNSTDQIILPDLSKYKNQDGNWKDGKQSIANFLQVERKMSKDMATSIANTLEKRPGLLSDAQLVFFSNDDITEWHSHLNERLNQIQKQKNSVNKLDKIANIIQFGKGEVNYGPREPGGQCGECRWGTFPDDIQENPGQNGICAIVAGEIKWMDGCDKFEVIPGMAIPPETTTTEETTDDENVHVLEPDEDGNCLEGYNLETINDIQVCVLMESPDDVVIIDEEGNAAHTTAPDADGNCPAGFTKSESNGTITCTRNEPNDEDLTDEQLQNIKQKKKNLATIMVEKNPISKHNDKIKEINNEIHKLKVELNKNRYAIGYSKQSMDIMARRENIKKEIKLLEEKKRKLI